MSSSHTTLDAAATERKARLAKLRSLKRKQPSEDDHGHHPTSPTISQPQEELSAASKTPTTSAYLSGRNYDPSTRGPKLGFESAPSADLETLEIRAKEIAEMTKAVADAEEKEDRPIDLFKLRPKKPNWDLKRDVAKKMEVLNVQTDNAIARMVRERIEGQKKREKEKERERMGGVGKGEGGDGDGDGGEVVGMEGEELVEGIHRREREEAEEEKREEDEEEDI